MEQQRKKKARCLASSSAPTCRAGPAGEGAALVGAALAACPALARSDPAPTLAELAAWGVRRDGVLEARGL